MRRTAAVAGLLVALLALLIAPRPHHLAGDRSGDAALAGRVADVVGDDPAGYRGLGGELPAGTFAGWHRLGLTVLLLVWAAVALPLLGFRTSGAGGVWFPAADRLRTVGAVLSTAGILAVAHLTGVWLTVPWPLWAVATGAAAAGLTALVLRWRDLPVVAGGKPSTRWVQFGVSALLSVLALGFLAWP